MAELEIIPTPRARARVAGTVLAAFVIWGVMVFLLTGGGRNLFEGKTTIVTYMPDVTTLAVKDDVRLSGISIGTVTKMDVSPSLDPQRAVRVEMRVDTNYLRSVPADSQTSITADNLVGDQFISIDEGKSPIPVNADGTLASEPLKQAADRADLILSLQDKLHQVDDVLTQMSSPDTVFGKFMNGEAEYDEFVGRVASFQKSLNAFEGPDNPVGQALFSDTLYNKIRGDIAKVGDTLASIQRGEGAGGKLFASDQQYNDFVRELRDLRTSIADVNAGKGKLGPLLHDDESYRNIVKMLSQTDAMIASLTAGEGAIGQLLVSPQLYESLVGTLKGMQEMLADLQAHPQKYLRYKF